MHDLIIRGGTVVDGSGDAPYQADVIIDGNRITAVGRTVTRGREEIDARGKIVAPASSTSTPTMMGRQRGTPKWRLQAGMA